MSLSTRDGALKTCDLGDLDQAREPLRQIRTLILALEGLAGRQDADITLQVKDITELLEQAMHALETIQVAESIAAANGGGR